MSRIWTAAPRRIIDLAVLLLGLGALPGAFAGLPLFGDGASYFFQLALDRAPNIPNLRFAAVLGQLPALLAAHLTDDLLVLRHAFALSYGLLPWLSLVLCWLLVRRRAPWLILLPLLTLLAVQINFSAVSELLISLWLCWPFVLAVLLAPGAWLTWAGGVVLAPLLLLLHPLTFVAGLELAALCAWRGGGPWAGRYQGLALWFGATALARLAWTALASNPYERAQWAPEAARLYLLPNTDPQCWLLALVAGLGLAITAWTRLGHPQPLVRGRLPEAIAWGAGGLLPVVAVVIGLDWLAGEGIRLKVALTWALGLGMLGLAVVAAGPAIRPPGFAEPAAGPAPPSPPLVAGLVLWASAAILLLTLARAGAWWTATHGLRNLTAATPAACLTYGAEQPYDLQWPWMRVLDNWAAPLSALVFRGDPALGPVALLLSGDGCQRLAATGVVHLNTWIQRPFAELDARFGPLRRPAADGDRSAGFQPAHRQDAGGPSADKLSALPQGARK